ncbi:MAG: hypothetical protein V3V18_13805 [Methylococcales bacterium]
MTANIQEYIKQLLTSVSINTAFALLSLMGNKIPFIHDISLLNHRCGYVVLSHK